MEVQLKEIKITGTGSLGASRPGTPEVAEQASAASSSVNCERTAYEADPRADMQMTIGKKQIKETMESTTKSIKITGAGEIGGPRPGAKGIQRVPLASSSDDHRGQQVAEQACSSSRATGSTKNKKGKEVKITISEDSSSDESFPPKKGNASKRRKRTIPSTTPSASDVEMCSGSDKDGRQSSGKPRAPHPSKASKKLPTDEERLAEIRHVPTANLAVNILEVADSIEQMAATAGNLNPLHYFDESDS